MWKPSTPTIIIAHNFQIYKRFAKILSILASLQKTVRSPAYTLVIFLKHFFKIHLKSQSFCAILMPYIKTE